MKNTTTTTTDRANDLYTTAEKAVYIALRARHEKSGLQCLADLQNAQHTDRKCRTATATAERISDLEKEHDSHRQAVEFYTARANRLTLTAEERKTALATANEHRKIANRLTAEISTLYDSLTTAYTDRADLTHTAILKALELEQNPAPITAPILSSYGAETAEELTEEERTEAQQTANFRAVINAVGKAISTLTTPEALNSTKTKVQPISLEQVAEYINTYGIEILTEKKKIPVPVSRIRLSDCYITIEERHTKTQDGYYKVTHYHTVAPYQYIEDYTADENGESDAQYIKTYNPIVSTFEDLTALERLAENLTDKERTILFDFSKYYGRGHSKADSMLKAYRNAGVKAESTAYRHFARLVAQLESRARALHIIK